jgi:hypothetical protein
MFGRHDSENDNNNQETDDMQDTCGKVSALDLGDPGTAGYSPEARLVCGRILDPQMLTPAAYRRISQ